ncbi:hypothetical protein Acr_00g0036570 [Actinidia rufa]|uniref:MBD domain-containing protein n=1 Tax=Actinidia rufa TaxID=165716 RepID=A0A7J0DGZ5_9ERIC|nr:hypothetical protein Acr_00g0036570 [Actinidia rufa]
MADKLPAGLPPGWFLDHKVRRDGTVERFYRNFATGQKFKTKEELMRFANYHNNINPRLEEFKACYTDGKGRYLERPWETDPNHTFQDYLEGQVGKLKDKAASGSSAAPVVSDVTDMTFPEKPQEKKGKAKKKK